jgi:tripartite-type tricarboxylate transporter receptor subunit TctC
MTISPTHKCVTVLTAVIAGLGFVALTSAGVTAQDKPAIEVVTHAGAGGGTDVNSRMMMLRSRRTLKQDMVRGQGQDSAQGRGHGAGRARHQ